MMPTRGLSWDVIPVPGTGDRWTVVLRDDSALATLAPLQLSRDDAAVVANLLHEHSAEDALAEAFEENERLTGDLNAMTEERDKLLAEIAEVREELEALREEGDVPDSEHERTTCGCGFEIVNTEDGWQHDAAPHFWGGDHDAHPG